MKPPTLKTAARLEARARKLWNSNLFIGAPEYAIASVLWGKAQEIRARETLATPPRLTP